MSEHERQSPGAVSRSESSTLPWKNSELEEVGSLVLLGLSVALPPTEPMVAPEGLGGLVGSCPSCLGLGPGSLSGTNYSMSYAITGLTEAVITSPGRAMLFYGRHSMGEALSLGEARDAAFMLTREGMWVGRPAYLAADPLTLQEGQQTVGQAIADCQIRVRGPQVSMCKSINLI